MKRNNIFSVLAASLMAMSIVACADNDYVDQIEAGKVVTHVAAVQTLTPMPDESGAKRVFEGDEVVLTGQNLDHVANVYINETEAEIVKKAIRELTFKVPTMGFARFKLLTPNSTKLWPHY